MRLLVVYTPKALTDLPDIHSAVALVLDHINTTLANSEIALTARLVGMDRVDYAETTTAARFGINVVNADLGNCAYARSAAHETGHNLGAAHDRYVVPDAAPGPGGYNYGFVDGAYRISVRD